MDIPAKARFVGPIGSVARTVPQRPKPPVLMPVRRRKRTYVQYFGESAVKPPKMVFRTQANAIEPFLPKKESER